MIEFVTSNIEGILAVVLGLHAVALAVVNLTPTPKDNEVLGKVYSVVEWLAGIVTKKAKT